jgi:(R,R)-butanediol dehydrogenase/meso-butanediol dehydrogenase/diacetyl reductase
MSMKKTAETMREAVLTGKRKIEIQRRPLPRPKSGQVLVRIQYCGICGSDVHVFEQGRPQPLTLGHEFSGTIAEVGPSVEGWKEGEAVAVRPSAPCGICPWCSQGLPHLCERSIPPQGYGTGKAPGAYADFMVVDALSLHRLPPEITLRDGAFAEPLAVVLHAVRISRFKPGDRVLVLGCGTIGLLTVYVLSQCGAGFVQATDPMEAKRKRALELGADHAYEPAELSRRLLDEQVGQTGPDIVFECVGIPQTLSEAFDLAPKRGQVLVLGVGMEPSFFLPKIWVFKELNIQATFGIGQEFALALRWLAAGRVLPEAFITREISLEKLPETMELLSRPNQEGKVVVRLV